MPDASDPPSEIRAAVWWHVGFALCTGVVAVVLLAAGSMSGALAWALAIVALPGAAGLLLRQAGMHGARLGLLILWSLAAAAAAALAGGVTGPLAPLVLTPALAALALGGRRLLAEGGALTLGSVALAGLAQASALAPLSPTEPTRMWLSLFALATVGAWGAAALSLALRRPGEIAAPERRADAALVAALARVDAAEAARDDALAANRAKSRFLAEMSHELRTPLNAVLGFSDTMRMRMFGPISDRYGEYAELIHESGRHLLDLINDLLDMSKIEADRYELDREPFDVGEAAAAAVRLVRRQADEAGVSLRTSLPPRPLEVDADRRAIKQIVINLLANAVKFTPSGGAVTLAVQAAGSELEIVVSDTGVGIAPEDLRRLGRPYEQAGEADQRSQGTGLGLSLVRALAGLHGGAVTIESRLGDGTAVTVRLPVLIAAEVTRVPPPRGEGQTREAGQGGGVRA